jgi:hypothetical protein
MSINPDQARNERGVVTTRARRRKHDYQFFLVQERAFNAWDIPADSVLISAYDCRGQPACNPVGYPKARQKLKEYIQSRSSGRTTRCQADILRGNAYLIHPCDSRKPGRYHGCIFVESGFARRDPREKMLESFRYSMMSILEAISREEKGRIKNIFMIDNIFHTYSISKREIEKVLRAIGVDMNGIPQRISFVVNPNTPTRRRSQGNSTVELDE